MLILLSKNKINFYQKQENRLLYLTLMLGIK